ncbi:MBL fold metallo-hydrolase [Patescibacteria group bacterium]|nr:MBL fold metallo-hydrolase [Patescibacteria group bacterium]
MRKFGIAALIVGVLIAAGSLVTSRSIATVRFFDIGQGDSAMISVGKTQMLIDGGPDRSVLNGVGKAMPVLDHRIEYVVLSHPHTDHYRGLVDVLKHYQVTTLILGVPGKEEEYQAFIKLAKEKRVNIVRAASQSIRLGSSVTLQIVHPSTPFPEEPLENPHDASVVGVATIGRTRILFTGDAEKKVEDKLLNSGINLDTDILKVGHHGSRTSSTEKFLTTVTPKVSVISVGANNRYGHPTPVTLQSLANIGSRVFRTDEKGTVTVSFSASTYFVKTEH